MSYAPLTLFQKVDSLKNWFKRKVGNVKQFEESEVPNFVTVAVCSPSFTRCGACLSNPQGVEEMKRELDTLLMEWKPQSQNLIPMDVTMNPVRVCCTLLADGHIMNSMALSLLLSNRSTPFSQLMLNQLFPAIVRHLYLVTISSTAMI
jgi:hypothetical protein